MKKALAFLVLLGVLEGCAPTLQTTKVSSHERKAEEMRQVAMAAELKTQREGRLRAVLRRISDGGSEICRNLSNGKKIGCNYPIKLLDGDDVNAFADGSAVYINSGLLRFVESDDELALVIGHELAHNLLGHREKKTANALLGAVIDVAILASTGVDSQGTFANAGAGTFSQGFEAEADYAGIYLARAGGFDITQAANFWRRMGMEHESGLIKKFNSTHPSTPERYIALDKASVEISNKLAIEAPLFPNRKSGEVPPSMYSANTRPTAFQSSPGTHDTSSGLVERGQ